MLRKNDNKFFAAVAEGTQLASALPAEGVVVSSSNLPLGGVVITDLGLVRLSEAALVALGPSDQFFIVQGKGANSPLLKSEVLTKGRITITKAAHLAAVQQITGIGFNGTVGVLPAANDTSYYVNIRKNDNDAANRSQGGISISGQYKSGGSATQEEVALGLAKNLVKNLADEATPYMNVQILIDGAGAALAGANTIFGLTYGSREVTADGLSTVVVGDWIRFGANVATGMYKVTEVSATGLTLATPYTGPTNAAFPVASATSIVAVNAAAADFGLTLEGIAAPFDVVAFRHYYANRFTASFSDSDTPITHLQGAREGLGVWQKVAMDEYMTYGFEGQNEMISVPPRARDKEVIDGAKYSAIEIRWTEAIGTLVTSHGASGSVLLYCGLNASSQLPATTAAGSVADFLGAIAVPTFASTDLNEV